MTVLMLIGGSPSSTAGGFKTTTLAVLIGNASFLSSSTKKMLRFLNAESSLTPYDT